VGTHVSKLLTDEDVQRLIRTNTAVNPTPCELCGYPGARLSLCTVCLALAKVIQRRKALNLTKRQITIQRLRDYRDGGQNGQTL
jgi:hypothetical protein